MPPTPSVKLLSVISTRAQGWNHALWMSWGISCFVKTESRRTSFSHPHLTAYCNTWKESTIRRLFGERLWLQSSISRSLKVMDGWGKTPHWSRFTWQKSQPQVACWNWRLAHVREGVRATAHVTTQAYHVQRHVIPWPAVTCVEIRRVLLHFVSDSDSEDPDSEWEQ